MSNKFEDLCKNDPREALELIRERLSLAEYELDNPDPILRGKGFVSYLEAVAEMVKALASCYKEGK